MAGLYGVMARFASPEEILEAAKRTHGEGYRKLDAFTPMPVEGLSAAIGFPKTRMPLIMFLGGITGTITAYLLQWWISAVDYPVDVGGRPYASWPAFTIPAFEMTILFAAVTGLVALYWRNGLPRPHHPVFGAKDFDRATTDRFFLLVLAEDPRFDPDGTRAFLASLGAEEVVDVEP